jgi:hypothetical protein
LPAPSREKARLMFTFTPPSLEDMKLKSLLAKPLARFTYKKIQRQAKQAVAHQQAIFTALIQSAQHTAFGQAHDFAGIDNYNDFKARVPIRDYEALKPWFEKIKQGEPDILWKGKPIYLAKTSGTTSGAKYIPITKDSISNHIQTARNALLCYMAVSGNAGFVDGKMIFLSGSPVLSEVGGIPTGRLSGIVNHHIPGYLKGNQLPTYETNCIEDWETKLDHIVEETIQRNMTLISGIPPWMQMYFDRLVEKSGKPVGELFPNFQVMVQGGVNFEPYKSKLFQSIGRPVNVVELFPASEGFFAFQDNYTQPGLLLNTNSGIFFEFVPAQEIFSENPTRLMLEDVVAGENYALIVSSNAGLWAYNIGDTVKFISTNPYKLIVSGRIKHYISAFGEHVIGEEVEYALQQAATAAGVHITEFTVAPMIAQGEGQSYHEWFVEFEQLPANLPAFAKQVDDNLRRKNMYYEDLIAGNILLPLRITPLRRNAFIEYMKSQGKLGGQNKVPRLSNDRKIAGELAAYALV